jgi:hypothetical protein
MWFPCGVSSIGSEEDRLLGFGVSAKRVFARTQCKLDSESELKSEMS